MCSLLPQHLNDAELQTISSLRKFFICCCCQSESRLLLLHLHQVVDLKHRMILIAILQCSTQKLQFVRVFSLTAHLFKHCICISASLYRHSYVKPCQSAILMAHQSAVKTFTQHCPFLIEWAFLQTNFRQKACTDIISKRIIGSIQPACVGRLGRGQPWCAHTYALLLMISYSFSDVGRLQPNPFYTGSYRVITRRAKAIIWRVLRKYS